MILKLLRRILPAIALMFTPLCFGQVPTLLNHQGLVSAGGTNFTGTGQFQFALVDQTGASLWSNGTGTVSVPVSDGLYSVLLGSTNLMTAVPASVFTNLHVALRVWFNDGVTGLQQLAPDQRIAAVGYAMMAKTVADGAITSNKLATGAVTAAALAPGVVSAAALAAGTITSNQLGAGAVGNVNLANNSITVTAGSGLTGGGAVALGGSTTVSLNLNSTNTWTASQTVNGSVTVAGAVQAVSFSGNGAGLTGITVPAGAIASSNLAPGAVTGTAIANGAVGSTQLAATAVNLGSPVVTGILPDSDLSHNVALLNATQNFSGQNTFAGNVGIGTASPGDLLEIFGTTSGQGLRLNDGTFFHKIDQRGDTLDISANVGASGSAGDIRFNIRGATSPQMIINQNGNVGIGTVNPSMALDVVVPVDQTAGVEVESANTSRIRLLPSLLASSYNGITVPGDQGIIFQGSGSAGSGSLVLAPWANATSGIRIETNGNVAIGKRYPATALDVNGDVSATRLNIGTGHTLSGNYATIAGGETNNASGTYAVIGGGLSNIASGDWATVSGGGGTMTIGLGGNIASANYATVGGGSGNNASGWASTVAGGAQNTAGGPDATVPGGDNNIASGYASFAAGTFAAATNNGAFVWADNTRSIYLYSSADYQFTVRASGGVRFFSNSYATLGAQLAANATAWTTLSDRNAKENIEPINVRDILAQLVQMPVSKWSYKADPAQRRYVGPMAQDFHAAFGLGDDDKRINTLDTDGVTLAAIQGLYQELQDKDAQLHAENAELKARLTELEKKLNALVLPAGK